MKNSRLNEGGHMKGRFWTIAAGLAALAALIAVPAAVAAYSSPKLEVTQTSTATTIKASLSPTDDPTASVRIFAPTGTQVTTNQAPGSSLGTVSALVKALDLGGADLPLQGQIVVAAPGQVPGAIQAACLGSTTPVATWVLVLSAAGQTLQVPAFLVATSGAQAALGPAYIQVCLGPPDVPSGTPGRATFGAKLYSVQAAFTGVFSAVPVGAWVAFWTPYTPGAGKANVAGTVASPAAVAPGAVSITAKTRARGAVVTVKVTQGGQTRGGVKIAVWGGAKKTGLKKLGSVTNSNGTFSLRTRTGTYFQARVAATSTSAAPLCSALSPGLGGIPCVNPTVNGFVVKSRVVKKK
jgi:hypothetical protein